VREVVAGEMVIVKAKKPHGFINVGDGVLKQVDIHPSPGFKHELLDLVTTSI
jgi:mannose-6-phosphate isomerase-like protein (cupin superfamily)